MRPAGVMRLLVLLVMGIVLLRQFLPMVIRLVEGFQVVVRHHGGDE